MKGVWPGWFYISINRVWSRLYTKSKVQGFGHIEFELEDVNALFVGHEHLKAKGYEHSWGIGRQVPTGNIFDYWFDGYGNRFEHFYGGDLLNEDDETMTHDPSVVLDSQWGAKLGDRRASLKTDYDPLRTQGGDYAEINRN